MSQFLFKWIFIVLIEIIHITWHVQIVEITIGTRRLMNVPDTGPITSVSVARNYPDPFLTIYDPETDKLCQFLGLEILKMIQHSLWPQKLMLWVSRN
jgi:hypothetical protein